jgi:hypothetical protein
MATMQGAAGSGKDLATAVQLFELSVDFHTELDEPKLMPDPLLEPLHAPHRRNYSTYM